MLIRRSDNRDQLVADKAKQYASALIAAVPRAHTEEDIKIASERQLGQIEKDAEIKLEARHEFTVASGRADSVYDRVVIEYKNPKSSADRIGPDLDSPGTKKVVAQIKARLGDIVAEYGQPINSLLGVGLDGRRFVFSVFEKNSGKSSSRSR
jgi:hypothetical protein